MGTLVHRESTDLEPWKVRRHPRFKKMFQVVTFENEGKVKYMDILFRNPREAQDIADMANKLWNKTQEEEAKKRETAVSK